MALTSGTRLGPYEVTAKLGEGGMGEVWRARDTTLDRFVALKVLTQAFADDPDRLARFEREAKILASLNHPNIAHIFGLAGREGRQGPVLVMELVEGTTLADRIPQGGLPLRDALTIALQIAEALEAAHEQGIVHRDLKPANVKVRPDGTVKVLDFGLAKIFAPDAGGSDAANESATMTALRTEQGVILGTPAYMSPEQARGEAVDRRTDIWAFGCVLYEMLTGRRAFSGANSMDVIARVLTGKPDLEALPRDTPASIRRLLQRCLAPTRKERLQDIGDARLDISEALTARSDQGDKDVALTPRGGNHWLETMAVAAIAAAIAGCAVWFMHRPGTSPAPVSRFAVSLPPSLALAPTSGRNIAMSPDGARMAYRSQAGVVVRSRDRLDGTLLAPVVDEFFFSADGKWLAYIEGNTIKKVAVSGGPAITIAAINAVGFGTWSGNDIVFADANGVFRVSGEGGTPEALLKQPLAATEQAAFPEVLPDGKTVIFTVASARGLLTLGLGSGATARIEALDLDTGTHKPLVRGGAAARYLPTGHLLYATNGALQTIGFDAASVEVRGEPVDLPREMGSVDFAVSPDGSLAYILGSTARGRPNSDLVWVDRTGRAEPLGAPPRPYIYPRLSPDGTRLALIVTGGTSQPDRDVWIWNFERRLLELFTEDKSDNATIAWSPNGEYLAFASARTGTTNLFWQRADGGGMVEHLVDSPAAQTPIRFAPDGRLLVSADVEGSARDIQVLSLDVPRRLEPLIVGKGSDLTADVAPDGRWIAYDSNESGRFEVYVRPYPRTGDGRWVISTNGGRQPLWSRDGRELYYRDFTGALIAVAVGEGTRFLPGAPAKLLDGAGFFGGGSAGGGVTYDVSRDGRFLMIKGAESSGPPSLVVVQNWFQELQRLVGTDR